MLQGNALRADEARTVTLKEVIQGCKIEFLNEDSWKYDCDHSGNLVIPHLMAGIELGQTE